MKPRYAVALAVLVFLAWSAAAGADELFGYYGSTVNGPQFNRPNAVFPFAPSGQIVSYHTQAFQVNQQATCIVDSIQNGLFDGFLHVYQGAPVNPLNPQANVIRGDDDNGGLGIGSSRVTAFIALANIPYFVVTSAKVAGTSGDFQNTVYCNSQGLPNPLVITHGDCVGVQNNTQTCLNNGRFRVSATFISPGTGQVGDAEVVQYGTGESALFTFFGPQNFELLVKVLNFCPFAENVYRVFAAGTTTVGVTLRVLDQLRGGSVTITNPPATNFANQVVNLPNSCP